ncbi:hypothetical protein RIF29_11591 [Crotalaria pallida]|uniref:Uncharacterized protein n=1 Tax=Crotalaria pallida TaxID=3830 RepID=A0AAN9P1D3_CROPI
MASNSRSHLKRQCTLPKQKSPTKDAAVEKDSSEEKEFSAVAAANEIYYDENVVLYAITGKKPAEAEGSVGAAELDKGAENSVAENNDNQQLDQNAPVLRRSIREHKPNSQLRWYKLK